MPRKKQSSTGARRKKDPHARREAARYEKPIASRELILDVITEADRPLDQEELRKLLGIQGEEAAEALRRRMIVFFSAWVIRSLRELLVCGHDG